MAKIFTLQSSNYTEIQLTATANIAAGSLVTAGASSNVFTLVDVLDTERYTGILFAEKVLALKAAVAIVPGQPIYLDVAAGLVTNVSTGNILVGFAQQAALSGDASVVIVYDGIADYLGGAPEIKTVVTKITADASAGIAVAGLSEGDEIIGAYVICTAANASGTLLVETGAGDDITNGMICAVDKVVVNAGTIDDANSTLPATGAQILSVGGTAANTRGIVVISYIPATV